MTQLNQVAASLKKLFVLANRLTGHALVCAALYVGAVLTVAVWRVAQPSWIAAVRADTQLISADMDLLSECTKDGVSDTSEAVDRKRDCLVAKMPSVKSPVGAWAMETHAALWMAKHGEESELKAAATKLARRSFVILASSPSQKQADDYGRFLHKYLPVIADRMIEPVPSERMEKMLIEAQVGVTVPGAWQAVEEAKRQVMLDLPQR